LTLATQNMSVSNKRSGPAGGVLQYDAMALVVRNIRLSLDEPEERIQTKAVRRLRVRPDDISQYAVVRRSLDARGADAPEFVYTVELALTGGRTEEARCIQRAHGRNVARITPRSDAPIDPGSVPLKHRPVIVGFGPAGMFAALRLAEYGYHPIVLERGRDVRTRHRDVMHEFYRQRHFNPESNLLFGEGGAGTYSDGKVYTRVHNPLVRDVLATLCRFGARPDVLIDAKPHIGSDLLPTICRRMREHIEKAGGTIRFGARVDDLEVADEHVSAVRIGDTRVEADVVLLGIGHSARDTYRILSSRGVAMEAKPFQLGVRIEHPQSLVDTWQYGTCASHPRLPPADYQLVARGAAASAGDLFSFCMCPGGTILPTNESESLIATNGASRSTRSGPFANSGFVITVDPADVGSDPLAALEYQRRWEQLAFEATGGTYQVPAQRCTDFLADRASDGKLETSYPLGGRWTQLRQILPPNLISALCRGIRQLDRKMPGFAGPDAIITAPETRASAPIRIVRGRESRESISIAGLYPIGEGAGYAGGIISAAIDGIRSAEGIIRTYQPFD